ncbi:hypothetical protein [Pseudomaricurvus sp. HS19]|uniref:hypothetical protein n=1 Tax=Pseudomaricurvus sp. HS19 TaxID=2692626 RepID=UPI00136DFDE5|nr:hypothetical protein [Pseudomaricurvus sp. HS19]MYM64753.1 hypothetical protein [Pseudomaricurvus sp. HS19]
MNIILNANILNTNSIRCEVCMTLVCVRELYREKASGLVAHNGLELNYWNGDKAVFHNSPESGPEICSYSDFAEGQDVTVKAEHWSGLNDISFRLREVLRENKSYCPASFNCEQAVSLVVYGVASSPQVKSTVAGALLFGISAYLLGGNGKQICAAVTVGAGLGLTKSKAEQLRQPASQVSFA